MNRNRFHLPELLALPIAIWIAGFAAAGPLDRADGPQGKAAEPDLLGEVCDYGITLAFRGDLAAADSQFTSLLLRNPRDPRALTNLGNLHLLRGDFKDALGFYTWAQRSDTTDPGILLNQGTAFYLMGDDESALVAVGAGIRKAGGLGAAATLLGIRIEGRQSDSAKTGAQVYLGKDEIRALLEAAAAAIPSDSVTASKALSPPPPAPAVGQEKKTRKRIWRSAGARGLEYGDAAALMYWKR